MKNTDKLKLILIILICVLVILFGFIGAYKKQGNLYKNILKDYKFASDIKGSTVMEFEVDDSVNTKYYDADGNEVEADSIEEGQEENYTTTEIPVNQEEELTVENYEKTVKIMKKRLSFLKADQYKIDLDKNTGKIVLTIDDDYIEDIENLLPLEGKLQLIDSKTEDVILDYTDFDSAEASYVSLDEGYNTYITLKLNKSGLEKIKNIDKYKVVETQNTENTEESKETSTDTTDTTPKFKLMFDSDAICEMEYDKNLLLSGKVLRITTKSEISSSSTLNSQLNINTVVSKLATYGKLPIIYTLSAEEFVKADILNYNNYIIISVIVICALLVIYLIFKYKLNGIIASLGFITSIAIAIMLIKMIGIAISLNVIAAIAAIIILNTVLLTNLLKELSNKEKDFKENVKDAYLKVVDLCVIITIILIVFAFANMTVISSVGLVLFWGYVSTLVGNLIFTVPMLYIINN